MAKTKEQLQTEADAEIESAMPMFKQVNNERMEFSDDDYAQAKIDLGNLKWEEQQFGYITARQQAYPSIVDFVEAYTENEIGGDDTKWKAYKTAYNKARSDNPKPS
tara:strand:- start:556 stop:873 length:318 start_codon:yes stop_codon:yes gene_type:complete